MTLIKKTLLLVGSLLASTALSFSAEKPNIIVFLADDMGWGDSATYGHELIETPNIDKLASQGVKFTQCYSASGVCSPSRSSILTGRTPYRNGVWRHLSGNGSSMLRESEITYPELLKGIGYETCHVGKWHLLSANQYNKPGYPNPGKQGGYDYWMTTQNNAVPSHKNPKNFIKNGEPLGEIEGYSAQIVAGEANKWIKEMRDPAKPFALSIWLHEPHKPIATAPKFEALYEGHPNKTYMGNISQLDNALGMVMDALDAQGLTEDTILIFTSDNDPEGKGEVRGKVKGGSTGGLRGRKRSDHEGGIRVPGIVRWPGHIKAGSVSDVPVIGTDIFSTILEIVDIALPEDRVIDGVSMLPAFEGKAVEREVPLFWRTHVSPPGDRVAMRIGDWKIVGDETLKNFQLYEIQKDWKEEHDLAEEMPEKTEEMKETLLALWKEIEKEGPSEWWKESKQRSKKGKVNY